MKAILVAYNAIMQISFIEYMFYFYFTCDKSINRVESIESFDCERKSFIFKIKIKNLHPVGRCSLFLWNILQKKILLQLFDRYFPLCVCIFLPEIIK